MLPSKRFSSLFSRLIEKIITLDWGAVLLLSLIHFATTWAGFAVAGETDLIKPSIFPYYYMTTVSTVGYGDYSPATEGGRWLFSTWQVFGGLTIFTILLSKGGATMINILNRRSKGMGNYAKLDGAIVLIGYHDSRTPRLVDEIRAGLSGEETPIVLVSLKDVPPNREWTYVKADSLADSEALKRGGVENASKIVAYADNDDLTMAAVLAARHLNTGAHIVAYFDDATKAQLMRDTCGIETVASTSVEQVARELLDPGAYGLIADLLSSTKGVRVQSVTVPDGQTVDIHKLIDYLHRQTEANFLSLMHKNGREHLYDIRDIKAISGGDTFFIIAGKRITDADIKWEAIA